MSTHTSEARGALIGYAPPDRASDPMPAGEREQLIAAAAVEPILMRWKDRCTPGLIDDRGKIRNIFTKDAASGDDHVSQVIRELNEIPEAVDELEAAWAARRQLTRAQQHLVEMEIGDARELEHTSLHDNGFQLEEHRSAVRDWMDDRELAAVYYPEINDLVRRVTGATHTFSNNHLRRQSEPEVGGDGPLAKLMAQSRGPVVGAHNDFTESYGEGLIRTVDNDGIPHTQTFGLTQAMIEAGITAEELRASRLMVVNTWRSVGPGPLRRYPLAVADRRSIPRSSLRSNLIGAVPSGEPRGGIDVYGALHDPAHRWFHYPGMTADEVLIWKGYDSAEVPAMPTLHTSFDDPTTPADAPERISIEVRVLCLLPT